MYKIKMSSTLKVLMVFSALLFSLPLAASAASPATVNLGSSGNFAILAKTGISTTGSTHVVGDLGVSPAQATYITGFSLILPNASPYSTSATVTGKVYAPGYADPTASVLTTAVLDMQTAYTDAMGRAPDVTELGAGNIGGLTLVAGVYKWGTGLTIPSNVTLSGSATDVWIFQIAQNLDVSSSVQIVLAGGAKASNIFWVVAGQTTIGTAAIMNGNILDQTAIVFNTGATLTGRALAQTAVTLDANAITVPATIPGTPSPAPTPAPTPTPSPTPTPTPSPTPTPTPASSPTVCTMDVMMCSDGSYVSRNAPSCGFAACPSDIAALEARLEGLRTTLQTMLAARTPGSQQVVSTTGTPFGQQVRAIAMNMQEGRRDANVKVLQEFLIAQHKGPAGVALAHASATSYFGPLTRKALAEFQASVGINPPLGYFGAITRAHLQANY